jgi:hypothetical protein
MLERCFEGEQSSGSKWTRCYEVHESVRDDKHTGGVLEVTPDAADESETALI